MNLQQGIIKDLSVKLSLVKGSLEYLELPLLKFNYFQYSSYLFPKVFSCQISWNSNEGFSRNSRISAKAIPHSIATFWLTTHALRLSLTKNNLRIAGFFASLYFLTYTSHKRLKPEIRCVQLWGKIAHIARALTKQNDRSVDGMFVLAIFVRALNCISKSARENCVRPP